jgi:hypothetical protein
MQQTPKAGQGSMQESSPAPPFSNIILHLITDLAGRLINMSFQHSSTFQLL